MSLAINLASELSNSALLEYLTLADEVFVHARKRSGTLRERYKFAFVDKSSEDVFLATLDGRVSGGLTTRRFEYVANGEKLRGSMLGFVCVAPGCQGRGIGRQLLDFAVVTLAGRDLDFAVLWTTIPAFYIRSGWLSSDVGVMGTFVGGQKKNKIPSFEWRDWRRIEAIRKKFLQAGVTRSGISYQTIPVGVEEMQCVFPTNPGHNDAYALVGSTSEYAVLYEMVGSSCQFSELWSAIAEAHEKVLVNEAIGAASFAWMHQRLPISWQKQQQAMWLGFNEAFHAWQLDLHVPYFDRI